ncbi:hypothetical protein [Bradyrhizobium sp. McL0615]
MDNAFAQMAANQSNIKTFGFTSLNSLSVISKLITYAAAIVAAPESQ